MKKLHYVRHGQSEMNKNSQWGGRINTPLSPEGILQAKAAGQYAQSQGLAFDLIISSPLDRAHDTAKHIANSVGYPVEDIHVHDLFVERGFGVMEGQTYAVGAPHYHPEYKEDQRSIDHVEGVESVDDVFERAKQAYAYIQSLPHDRILVVAHGAFGRAFRNVHSGKTTYEGGEGFPNAEIFELL